MPCPPPLKRLTGDGDELLKSTEAEQRRDLKSLYSIWRLSPSASKTISLECSLPVSLHLRLAV
jgi:hypothetical protein